MIEAINKSSPVIPGSFVGDLQPQDLEQAAVQFEAVFMRTLLQQMRKAAEVLAADDDPFNSKQQRMMRDFTMTNWPPRWHHSAAVALLIC